MTAETLPRRRRVTVSAHPISDDPSSSANVPSLLHPWDEESVEIAKDWFEERVNGTFHPPKYTGAVNAEGTVELQPAHPDRYGFQCQLAYALGSTSVTFHDHVRRQLLNAPGVAKADAVEMLNAGIAFISHQRPQNEIETLALLQIWITQAFSSRTMGFASRSDNLANLETQGSLGVKAGKLLVQQIEAFAKLRNAGKQVIEVQHVHVYPGGNAVVGTVNAGGVDPEKLGRPQNPIAGVHIVAALEDERGSALSCPDTSRDAVPMSRDAEPEAVLSPRRRERLGRTEG